MFHGHETFGRRFLVIGNRTTLALRGKVSSALIPCFRRAPPLPPCTVAPPPTSAVHPAGSSGRPSRLCSTLGHTKVVRPGRPSSFEWMDGLAGEQMHGYGRKATYILFLKEKNTNILLEKNNRSLHTVIF